MSHTTTRARRRWPIALAVAAIAAVTAIGYLVVTDNYAIAQMMHHGAGKGMHGNSMHGHGADGMGHDEVNMPGLRGRDASARESDELAQMFNKFESIERTVENLPNGIKTVTFSKDEELMAVISSHVVGMIQRVDEGRDPQIMIQSPTLDIFFERPGAITTQIEMTDAGIEVIQTSDDPEMVVALHTHAEEVSRMVDHGMRAVHEMMMERAGN